MKKLILLLCLLVMCASARATTITLTTYSAPSFWAYGTPATLRVYVNSTFVDSDGVIHMAQATGGPNFYQSLSCTVSSGTITIPSFTLASTWDSPTNPNATYSFLWYDKNGVRRDTFAANLTVPITLGTSITWSQLFVYNAGHPHPPGPQFPDIQQVQALINQVLPVADASDVVKGKVKLSIAPVSSSNPIAIGDNDSRIPTVGQGAALVGTSGTPGSGNKYVTDADARNTNSRAPNGSAGGDLGNTYPNPTVTQARGLRETAGPTTLAMGAVADGQFLKRSGSTIVGGTTSTTYLSVGDYGAAADALVGLDGAITSGSATFVSPAASFPLSIVGKSIAIMGAGPAGATLVTTVGFRSTSTVIVLADGASSTVSSARYVWGTSNATPFQNAMNAALAAGVRTVFAKQGVYFFPTGQLDIPQSVTLQGAFDLRAVHRGGNCGLVDPEYNPLQGDATSLLITSGEGSTTGHFFKLTTNSALKGVFAYYPAQIPSLATPKLYPWTIEQRGTGSLVENVEIGFGYNAHLMTVGDYMIARNVIGQSLNTGLYATQLLNSPTFENYYVSTVHDYLSSDPLNPSHSCAGSPQPLVAWQIANGEAFKFGRIDNGNASNLFVYGYKVGIHLVIDGATADGPGGSPWVNFNQGDLESTKPLIVDNTGGGVGAAGDVTNGVTFTNFAFGPFTVGNDNGVLINATFDGRLTFLGGGVNGLVSNGIYYKQGAVGILTVSNMYFQYWANSAIRLEGPAAVTYGLASITGSYFKWTGAPDVIHTSGRMQGAMSGNVYSATLPNVFSSSTATTLISCGDSFSDGVTICGLIANLGQRNIGIDPAHSSVALPSNIRGQATLSGGTVNVAFPVSVLADATYYLVFSSDTTGETFKWSAKSTSGFTITSSNAGSTAKVDWVLIR